STHRVPRAESGVPDRPEVVLGQHLRPRTLPGPAAGSAGGRPRHAGGDDHRDAGEAAAAADVQSAVPERRLHADGIRRACAGAGLRQEPRSGDRDHADRASPRAGGGRRLCPRDRRDQGRPGHPDGTRPPAPPAMHDGKGMSSRLDLAFPDGAEGTVLLIGADAQTDLAPFDRARTRIVQRQAADHAALAGRGWTVATRPDGAPADTAVVFLPRARDQARAWLAEAAANLAPGGRIWVDGQKIDGIDAMLKELRGLTGVDSVESKAHGKIFRLPGPADWVTQSWAVRDLTAAPGFTTRAGVFSA